MFDEIARVEAVIAQLIAQQRAVDVGTIATRLGVSTGKAGMLLGRAMRESQRFTIRRRQSTGRTISIYQAEDAETGARTPWPGKPTAAQSRLAPMSGAEIVDRRIKVEEERAARVAALLAAERAPRRRPEPREFIDKHTKAALEGRGS